MLSVSLFGSSEEGLGGTKGVGADHYESVLQNLQKIK